MELLINEIMENNTENTSIIHDQYKTNVTLHRSWYTLGKILYTS